MFTGVGGIYDGRLNVVSLGSCFPAESLTNRAKRWAHSIALSSTQEHMLSICGTYPAIVCRNGHIS